MYTGCEMDLNDLRKMQVGGFYLDIPVIPAQQGDGRCDGGSEQNRRFWSRHR